jgi:hypothetical protein
MKNRTPSSNRLLVRPARRAADLSGCRQYARWALDLEDAADPPFRRNPHISHIALSGPAEPGKRHVTRMV